ncbi:MAG: DedA family protein [Patescibacteria group bacterium]
MYIILHQIGIFLSFSKYVLVFLGCIVEGPIVMMTSGFLLRTGQFNFWPLYFCLVGGDFVADIGWYFVGRYAARKMLFKIGGFFGITPEIVEKIEHRFRKHQDKILFISKITMGFGFALATLLVAGILRVPFKRYVFLNLFGGFIWTAFLITVGYFFGNVYTLLSGPFKILFIAVIICGGILSLRAINKYLIKKDI